LLGPTTRKMTTARMTRCHGPKRPSNTLPPYCSPGRRPRGGGARPAADGIVTDRPAPGIRGPDALSPTPRRVLRREGMAFAVLALLLVSVLYLTTTRPCRSRRHRGRHWRWSGAHRS
jgi:hypothetical protein